MSSITMTSERMMRRMALAAVSSALWRRTSAPTSSVLAHWQLLSDRPQSLPELVHF